MRAALAIAMLIAAPALADPVALTQTLPRLDITRNGAPLMIERNVDDPALAHCPPFCLQPATATPDVATIAEPELLEFLQTGDGLLLDARLPEWTATGTIPGAVNIPFTALSPDNSYRNDILMALGATQSDGEWQFASAFPLVVFGNGPWSDQAARAIVHLRESGYPADRIRYYRGGVHVWASLGLTLAPPQEQQP